MDDGNDDDDDEASRQRSGRVTYTAWSAMMKLWGVGGEEKIRYGFFGEEKQKI